MLRHTQLESLASLPRPLGGGVAEGRRLGGGGALSGALHTLGYYSTDVCLGSPPKRYDLIIDTGSSITAVPCSSCRACGTHRCGVSGRYDLARSQTSKPVGCHSDAALLCESCAANRCGYSVHYTEGSAIRGHVVQDVAHLLRAWTSSRSEQRVLLPVYFGCQTSESGMFFKQVTTHLTLAASLLLPSPNLSPNRCSPLHCSLLTPIHTLSPPIAPSSPLSHSLRKRTASLGYSPLALARECRACSRCSLAPLTAQ